MIKQWKYMNLNEHSSISKTEYENMYNCHKTKLQDQINSE